MNGRSWATIALFLVMSLSAAVLNMDAVEGQGPLSVDILIDGNDELSSSEYVRGGPGTEASPYIISDLDFGSGSLDIRNITYYLVIRNITFDSGEDTAVHMYNTYGVMISNVSYAGRDVFMHLRSIRRPIIQNCRVTNMPDGSYFLRGDSLLNPVIRKNNLSSEGISLIEFDRFGGGLQMSGNDFHGMCITDKFFYQYDRISDNRFVDSYLNVENGTEAGEVEGNIFKSSKYNGVISYKCDELRILNNTFTTKIGLLIRKGVPSYRGIIKGNEFKECDIGVRAPSYYSDSRFVQWKISGNTFRNCTSYAIELDEPRYLEAWENRFIDNAGVKDGDSGRQVDFYYDSMDNKFTVDGVGNYWSNHRTPDDNCDGIVDEPYDVDYFTDDERPYSNIYFDTDSPSVLLHPVGEDQEDRSYVHFTWSVSDSGSGFHRAVLYVDGEEHDVTGLSGFPVLLQKGNHKVRLSGWDLAGIENSSEVEMIIPAEVPVVTFAGMKDGDYINTPRIRAAWKIPDYFEPAEQEIFLNGGGIEISPDSRAQELDLESGWNSIRLSVRDGYVTEVNRTIRVFLDDEKPVLGILSPADGSYLSNRIVNIRWEMDDNTALASAEYRLDENDWMDSLDTRELSSMLDTGEHTFHLKCSDRAGNSVTAASTFHITEDPGLKILSPVDGEVTSDPVLNLEWEYDGKMEWVSAVVIMDSGDPYGIAQIRKIEIPFDDLADAYRDGEMIITLRLMDEYENHIEKTVSMTLDREGPGILLLDGPDSGLISDPEHVFSWKGFDDTGIDHYEVKYDSGDWIDVGSGTSHATELKDGDHILSIAAFDIVGNMGRLDHRFTLDSTPPEIILISSIGGSFATDPVVTIQWDISDQTDIVESMLEVDGEEQDVTDRNSLELVLKEDGEHHVELTVEDMLGNTESESIVLMVDTKAPSLSWRSLPDGYVASGSIWIEWESYDSVGISEQFMDLDGERYDLEPEAEHIDLDVTDGKHTVRIYAVDHAGHESMIETAVMSDSRAPYIDFELVPSGMSDDPHVYTWCVEDGGSGTSSVEMKIDDGDWMAADEEGTYSSSRLSPGDHMLSIKAVDNAGNGAEESISFTVEDTGEDDSGSGSGLLIGAGAIVMIVILTAVGASAAILIRRNRKSADVDEKEAPKTPKRISLPNMEFIPRASPKISPALPPAGEKVLEATTGTGYIRPKEAKKQIVKHDMTLDPDGNRIP